MLESTFKPCQTKNPNYQTAISKNHAISRKRTKMRHNAVGTANATNKSDALKDKKEGKVKPRARMVYFSVSAFAASSGVMAGAQSHSAISING